MAIVHWSPNLSIGIDEIDAEHMELIDLLNNLFAEISKGSSYDKITHCFDQVVHRTQEHFRHEEAIMARIAYPELSHHRRIHEALIEEIRGFWEELDCGMEIGPEIPNFFKTWLISHILESDRHLGGFLEGRRA